MQFAHDSTSADPTVRPDRGQLARNPAMKQIREADRCTAVKLGDLIQVTSIRYLLKLIDWTATFSNGNTLEFIQNSQTSSTDEDFSAKYTKWLTTSD